MDRIEIKVIKPIAYLSEGDILTGSLDSDSFQFEESGDHENSNIYYEKLVTLTYNFIRSNEDCFELIGYDSWMSFDIVRKKDSIKKDVNKLTRLRDMEKSIKDKIEELDTKISMLDDKLQGRIRRYSSYTYTL